MNHHVVSTSQSTLQENLHSQILFLHPVSEIKNMSFIIIHILPPTSNSSVLSIGYNTVKYEIK